jgi:hypothetical protein
MDPSSPSSQGLFLADTRFLSRFQLRINDQEPVLLGSSEENLFGAPYLHTNPTLTDIPQRALGIFQHNRISEGLVRIEMTVANWGLEPANCQLSIEVDSGFFDSSARQIRRRSAAAFCTIAVKVSALFSRSCMSKCLRSRHR